MLSYAQLTPCCCQEAGATAPENEEEKLISKNLADGHWVERRCAALNKAYCSCALLPCRWCVRFWGPPCVWACAKGRKLVMRALIDFPVTQLILWLLAITSVRNSAGLCMSQKHRLHLHQSEACLQGREPVFQSPSLSFDCLYLCRCDVVTLKMFTRAASMTRVHAHGPFAVFLIVHALFPVYDAGAVWSAHTRTAGRPGLLVPQQPRRERWRQQK